MSGILSQAEIDAILNGKLLNATDVTEEEVDTLGEIGNISMGTAATTLYEILGKRVDITTPKVSVTTVKKMSKTYTIPYVGVEVRYTKGLQGYTFLVLKKIDALIITDLLMGGDGTDPGEDLDEIRLSALAEIMNQMAGSSATSLSEILHTEINIAPPKIFEVNFEAGELMNISGEDEIIKISFKMVIEDIMNSEIMQILPSDYAKDIVAHLLYEHNQPEEDIKNEPHEIKVDKEFGERGSKESGNMEKEKQSSKKVNVRPLVLEQFSNEKENDQALGSNANLNFLMDVPLPISIELGRSRKLIKEILELSEGSVVVLDKFAGDTVDVMVNGKLIARGEVVIVEENYGVRITEIVSSNKERI